MAMLNSADKAAWWRWQQAKPNQAKPFQSAASVVLIQVLVLVLGQVRTTGDSFLPSKRDRK